MSVDEMNRRKGRIEWLPQPLQSAVRNEQLDRPIPRQDLSTVDLIGQTDSVVGIVYIMLHVVQRRMFNVQFLIDNYNGDIKQIINHQRIIRITPLDYAYHLNNSPIKNEIVSLLRKYGEKANWYDKNGNVGKRRRLE